MTTSSSGVGNFGFGIGPYGFGTPAVAPTPGGLVNRGVNAQQYGSLALSLAQETKGQYIFDSYGRRTGMPDVAHMAILALRTELGSCIVQGLGNRFKDTAKITESFEGDQRNRVEEALSDLVGRKLITIDAVFVDGADGKPAVTRITLTDLSSKNPVDLAI